MRHKRSSRARNRQSRRQPTLFPGRFVLFDSWAATLAPAAIALMLAGTQAAYRLPGMPGAQTYHILLVFLLLVAAAAGRALVGFRRPPDAGPSRPWPKSSLLLPLAIIAAAIIPYLAGLGIGFLGDDFQLASALGKDATPREAMGDPVLRVFYRPLVLLLWWWLQGRLGEATPLGLAILSLALHAANSLLVYVVGRRIIRNTYGAALAAMLFAVHPIRIETVLWKSCLPDLLATAFCLLSLLCVEVHLAAATRRRQRLALAGALACYLLALFSKEAALALPAFIILRIALADAPGKLRRTFAIAGAHALALAAYLALRLSAIGHIGGYRVDLTSLSAWLPSQPLRQIGVFLFPVHTGVFPDPASPWLWAVALICMVAFVAWWSRGLTYVPAARLWLWLGYVFIMALPVWLYGTIGVWLSGTRFAYLPTIGLAWLFGDTCAGRGRSWRQSGAVAAAALLGAALLIAWYINGPWREADRLTRKVIAESLQLADRLPPHPGEITLFVGGLPPNYLGAPALLTGFPDALSDRLDRPATVRAVLYFGGAFQLSVDNDVLDRSVLLPGEYLLAWRPDSQRMEIVRSGGSPAQPPSPEAHP